jgi:hypothetical protein
MAAMNLLWGAPRIHGELRKLGIEVAERTVSRLVPKRHAPPSQTWRTFLANHVRDVVAIDFFTVPSVKVTFFRGTSLRPVPPGGTAKSKDARWIDIHEGDEFDEAQMATWVQQAAALPGWVP